MTNTARTSLFLMANLGSEVSQIFSHAEKGDWKMAELSASRAVKIIDELLKHSEMRGRTGEIDILKEVIEDAFSQRRRFKVKKSEIDEYFMPFALRFMNR